MCLCAFVLINFISRLSKTIRQSVVVLSAFGAHRHRLQRGLLVKVWEDPLFSKLYDSHSSFGATSIWRFSRCFLLERIAVTEKYARGQLYCDSRLTSAGFGNACSGNDMKTATYAMSHAPFRIEREVSCKIPCPRPRQAQNQTH